MARFLQPLATNMHGIAQAILLLMLIAGGMAIYGLLLALFGAIRWTDAVSAISQTTASDLRD
jgi:putative peptidoglycan lipid II flippase